ncbi:MAG: hypothetical protein HC782_03155 [Gammaproteobacteria bacterium]|nr:hypothetical protein [Gammaproteobacteria bacterium]
MHGSAAVLHCVVVIATIFSEIVNGHLKTALITHPVCLQHEMGRNHPESPARLQAVLAHLEHAELTSQMEQIDAPLASEAALAATHLPDYVARIFAAAPLEDYAYLDPDTS